MIGKLHYCLRYNIIGQAEVQSRQRYPASRCSICPKCSWTSSHYPYSSRSREHSVSQFQCHIWHRFCSSVLPATVLGNAGVTLTRFIVMGRQFLRTSSHLIGRIQGFFFLSPCRTTMGDESSPDEEIAAAMQFSGFIIGCVWSVDARLFLPLQYN
ncbi:hypothetical protein F4604DRAFT_495336 [Suillus subluteus]|nr:hypothetical protein F4604DRAFT_495336 [Suillus subluteus]